MKILKVKVKKQKDEMRTRYAYPEGWDSSKISVLAYEDNPENLGAVEEDCLCVTDEGTATKLLRQPGVGEVSKNEANIFGRKWRPSRARITDEIKITIIMRKLLAKPQARILLKQHLSQDEIDSLDEGKSNSGIGKGQEFDIEQYLQD